MKKNKRLIIIGWDGATYDVLKPLIDSGRMPNTKAMMENGASGIMESVDPPYTGPAWATFATGMNPGKHGLFSWKGRYTYAQNHLGYNRPDLESTRINGLTLWSYLSRQGKKICIINFPMTYPAEPVNGVLIGGLLAPSVNSDFVYPVCERDNLFRVAPLYRPDIEFKEARKGNMEAFLEHISISLEQKIKATRYYWEREEWDVFFPTFIESDCLQHVFWHCMDSKHPSYNDELAKKWGDVIAGHFQKLDMLLGDMLAEAKEDTYTLLLSDHGFGPAHYRVHINHLLKELGLMYTKKIQENDKEYEQIDWSRTKAYAGDTYEHCIYINQKGRDYFGIVSPGKEYRELVELLTKHLKKIKDPISKEYIVTKVMTSEEVYSSEFSFMGPDIIYETVKGEYLHSNTLSPKNLVEPSEWQTGCHRKNGIYVISGKDVEIGSKAIAKLQDIYPTVLKILDLPIPTNLEGKVMSGCFTNRSEIIE